ncbi:GNAT family N-acetyltransferase [Dongia rigui]|uniref:GNAT family N-acetyltransferase n=1 Tax=Dongia rigui TaxID=940149 RepID=A0ABU5DZD9_9PROT|nr:GNAT family N-acetyltransferase [Dongia rigui]MDY0871998.1 GNAT family N-acetyltransferase [Dongia rigui]
MTADRTGPVLQPIGPFDVDLLAELHHRCFTAIWDRPWNAKSFADVLAMPGAAGQILSVGDAPVGFGITLQAVDEVDVLLIGVLPEARGAGLGPMLLDSLLSAAASRGAARALLEVAAENRAAIATYTKVGFTICGRRKQYYPGPTDAILYERALNSCRIDDKSHQ